MKAVIFDLDDTLYKELDFVYSGFWAIATYLSSKYNLNTKYLFDKMVYYLEKFGRGKTFDYILKDINQFSKFNVNLLVYIYRTHKPNIKLLEKTIKILKTLKNKYSLGIITDGSVIVQKNKIEALGLEKFVDIIIYTDALGKRYSKPSRIPFAIMKNMMGLEAGDMIYIGDNPKKDFKGANIIGMKTVWLNPKNVQYEFSTKTQKPTRIVDSLENFVLLLENGL